MSIEPEMRVAPTGVQNAEHAGRRLAILATSLVTILIQAQPAPRAGPRDLTLRERFQAQRAIEQVYYAHQEGAHRTFAEAVPDSVIETKVRTYLKQSLALARLWRTPITEDSLRREASRMARDTRLPGRLTEISGALGNDPVLILECLARPVLADRLARSFFAFDERIHAGTRGRAETLRDRVVRRGAGSERDNPPPEVLEIRDIDSEPSRCDPRAERQAARPTDNDGLQVDAESFARWRSLVPDRVGEVGPLVETRDAFVFRILLEEAQGRIVIATHTVPKETWDAWWAGAESGFDETEVQTLVRPDNFSFSLPDHSTASWSAAATSTCLPDDTWDNGILNAFFSAREEHTAVWTGSVMIVWGGTADSTGGRYDPATDTWALTTLANAPVGRRWHTAVWTGSEMIVWGGASLGGSGNLNTGGRYDPVADRWAAISTVNAPSVRNGHSAVWSPRGMIVWGGYAPGYLNTGGIYDPTNDTWRTTSTVGAPIARYHHTAVWTGQSMIVWGGYGFGNLNTGATYDPSSDTWADIPGAPIEGRFLHSAVWTGSEMIVWGGQLQSGMTNTGARFRPASSAWFPMSQGGAPLPRQWHGVVWTGSEMIVWGGYTAGPPSAGRTGGRYDPARNAWSSVSSLNAPDLTRLAAVWTGSLMIAMGGQPVGGRYDPSTDSWTPTAIPSVPSPRSDHSAVWTGTQMIIWGGTGGGSTGGRYDPALDSWSPTSMTNVPASRKEHTAVWTGDRMVVWGGRSPALKTGGRYDPVADAWEPTSLIAAPSARFVHTAVWTGSEMIVWGGSNGTVAFQSGGRYDPRADTWRPVGLTGAPSGRAYHTAVWTGNEMVIWGGWDVSATMLGARYDPASDTWAPTSISNAPSARFSHTAVWTGRVMIVWAGIYGYSSGGRYDPAGDLWLATSLLDAPTSRDDHTAIWTGREMVVWGGTREGPTGGRYDPTTDAWRATSTLNAPSERGSHTAVWTGAFMIVWGGSSLGSGGSYAVSQAADHDGDGYSVCAGDCDDTRPMTHPGAPETCNGIDDDCSGGIDEGTDALCGDPSPCTADLCAGVAGCQHPPEADGTPCDEGNDCTVGDACQAGTCAAGPLRDTDDDGHADWACGGDDCADSDPAVWSTPVEVVNLAVGGTSPAWLIWDDQADLAGPGTSYDLVSGTVPSAGMLDPGAATCLRSSPLTSFEDARPDPPQDAAYWYLVRGRNACGAGSYGTPARDASIPPCP